MLAIGERIALTAEKDSDSRLTLLAIDRCQRSIDTLARIGGLLKGDGHAMLPLASDTEAANSRTNALPITNDSRRISLAIVRLRSATLQHAIM